MTDVFKKTLERIKNPGVKQVTIPSLDENRLTLPEEIISLANNGTESLIKKVNSDRKKYIPELLNSNSLYCDTKIYYVGSEDYYESRDYSLGNPIIPTEVPDTFRFVAKKYWTGDAPYYAKSDFDSSQTVPFDIVLGREVYDSNLNSTIAMKLVNRFTNGLDKDYIWTSYIKGTEATTFNIVGRGEINIPSFQSIFPSDLQSDFVFSSSPVFSSKETEDLSDGYQNLFDFECNYDFYIKNYEETLKNSAISENLIPNVYTITVENNKELSSDDKIHKFNTINNKISREVEIISGSVKNGLNQVYNLLDQWSRNIVFLNDQQRQKFVDQNRNYVFSLNELEGKLLNEIDSISNLYPIKVKGFLDIRKGSETAQVIKNCRSDKRVLNSIVDSKILDENSVGFDSRFTGITTQNYAKYDFKQKRVNSASIKSWDFMNLLKRTYSSQEEYKTSLDTYDPTFQETYDSFFAGIYPAVLDLNINKMIEKYDRTFEEILSGKLCHTDDIAYRIAKFEVNSFNKIDLNKPLQNYYFSNSSDLENFRLNDTQVKYGKTYRYIVFSYTLVFGNTYSYEIIDANKQEADVKITKSPKLKLLEIPIFESSNIKIKDRAPIPPDMKFSTYVNDSTTLNISLERMLGEYKEKPIKILRTDEKFIFRMADEDGLVQYGGDDNIEYFELYKSETLPTEFASFGQPYKRIKTSTAQNELARTPEVTVLDKILENRKYYYFSRAVDTHGNLSNPSFVYEVEIVNNSGAIYPVVRVFEFPKPQKYNFKNVNKHVRIYPSYEQTMIEGDASDIKNLKLGKGGSIWSKRFKFRFTSYNSGKKIDIDVRFKYYTRGYLFEFVSSGVATAIVADSFTEALSLLLIEQNIDLI